LQEIVAVALTDLTVHIRLICAVSTTAVSTGSVKEARAVSVVVAVVPNTTANVGAAVPAADLDKLMRQTNCVPALTPPCGIVIEEPVRYVRVAAVGVWSAVEELLGDSIQLRHTLF
jgi:hypothetical protein